MLGLIDDVDCAVVSVSWHDQSQEALIEHLTSIPALAYVATGAQLSSEKSCRLNEFCISRSAA